MSEFKTYSKKMQKINDMILMAANTDTNILIVGEKGVGKTLCAKRIHSFSSRAEHKLIEVSGATLYNVSGTYKITGEQYFRHCVSEAKNGTLFIDDITFLKVAEQDHLIEQFNGGKNSFRLIAATSKPLEPRVRSGRFREELYNHLCVIKVKLPSLRDRKEDIPFLIDSFMHECIQRYNKTKSLSSEVFDKLKDKNWPGNIHELECIIEYAFSHAKSDVITVEDLPPWLSMSALGDSINDQLYNIAFEIIEQAEQKAVYTAMEDYKKVVIPPLLKAITDCTRNNRSRSAEILGINRNTFKKLLEEYNLEEYNIEKR